MKLLGGFLSRFQNLTPPNDAVKKAIIEVIKDVAGVPLKKEQVTISNDIVFLQCSSIAKSTIRVQRGQIFAELRERLPKADTLVRDIR